MFNIYLEKVVQEQLQDIKERANIINKIIAKLDQKYNGMVDFSLFVKGGNSPEENVIEGKNLIRYLQDERNNDITISLSLTPTGFPSNRNVIALSNQSRITMDLLPKIIQIVEKNLKAIEKQTDKGNNQSE